MKLTVTDPDEQEPLRLIPFSEAEIKPPRFSLSEVVFAATAAETSEQTLLKLAPAVGGTVVVADLGCIA